MSFLRSPARDLNWTWRRVRLNFEFDLAGLVPQAIAEQVALRRVTIRGTSQTTHHPIG
jgi:hypothetical protein